MRSVVQVIALLAPAVAIAAPSIPIYAPDPGPAPPFSPVLNPAVIVIALFFGSAAVLWGVSAYVRGKITRKKLIATTSLLMLLTWGGLLLALVNAPANPEYQTWQQAHKAWQNKEVVGYEGQSDADKYDDIIEPQS
ncbi:hypothetical protein [Planctomycetes bacterium K23_9]|uniref:Uncharacterized protein n=1 Tax=Stieleria marina TaxID=1930275 RepID=A0A517P0B0_9BACT|nr:hypothetical protein K239x_48250 [Planctomycetes bacterium K23_9]